MEFIARLPLFIRKIFVLLFVSKLSITCKIDFVITPSTITKITYNKMGYFFVTVVLEYELPSYQDV